MRFREEVFAKIFTYITVILLLSAILFLSYRLYSEKKQKNDWKIQAEEASSSLSQALTANAELTEKVKGLEAFQTQWAGYAALKESREAIELKADLMKRPELVPEEAVLEAMNFLGIKGSSEEEPAPVYSFEDSQNLTFLPLSLEGGQNGRFLIYTAASSPEVKQKIELVYAVDFSSRTGKAEMDEDGNIIWKCLAYQSGNGWNAYEKKAEKRK